MIIKSDLYNRHVQESRNKREANHKTFENYFSFLFFSPPYLTSQIPSTQALTIDLSPP